MRKYNVIITGASFAGLAVSSKIKKGKILLVDAKPIGEGVKSACGTILAMVEALGLEEAVLQVHKEVILHLAHSDLTYNLNSLFCVIDEKKFCQKLFDKGKADFVKAQVLDFYGLVLKTNKGNFQADIFVDASGPNSVLTKNKNPSLSFGLETIVNYQEENLHFWYQPKIFPKGVFWLFPQGETSRIGVGSYIGKTNLLPYLNGFLARFGLKVGKLHGGYFPHRLGTPVLENIFLVGDAAGQCLPVSGEGIRPAIVFGQKCGEIIEKILFGKISLNKGLDEYKDFVSKRKPYYEIMFFTQRFLTNIPESLFLPLASLASKKALTAFLLKNYLKILENE